MKLIFDLLSSFYYGLGLGESNKGNNLIAMKRFEKALKYASKADVESGQAIAHISIAKILCEEDKYDEALIHAHDGIHYYKKFEDASEVFASEVSKIQSLIDYIQERTLAQEDFAITDKESLH